MNTLLTYEAKFFLKALSQSFDDQIKQLIKNREERKNDAWKNSLPDFLKHTRDIRDTEWTIAPPPVEIRDRRIEITGPPERKMIINALNSGANVFMADFEDSNSPTWKNCIDGQKNLRDAVNKSITYENPTTKKKYRLKDQTATLFVRPRGLHLVEKNFDSISASLFDFGLYFFHNYKSLLKKNSRPYFYLPKLEHYKEARLWNDIFSFAEKFCDLPRGTIRAAVLIETYPAVFQMNEILYELKEHSIGLNCGRWDYIFSFIKTFQDFRDCVLPDRDHITMEQHFLSSYSKLLIQTCHRRGAHAIGGMAAQIPIKNNPEANHNAMNKVRADKIREVQDGHDGTWVAHPVLVDVAKEVFDEHLKTPNQIHKQLYLNDSITRNDLMCVPKGACTLKGLKKNIRITYQYLNAWLQGRGCVPLDNLMEDTATAEISRTQIWQWLKYKIYLDTGEQLLENYFMKVMDEELKSFEDNKHYEVTKKALFSLCTSKKLIDFLTVFCYDELS